MNKVLAIDLDGTLFYPKSRKRLVSKKNVEFLQRFIDLGNKVVLVTSRAAEFVERVVKEIGREVDYLACTGAVIKINNEIVEKTSVQNKVMKTVIDDTIMTFKPLAILLTTEKYEMIVHALFPFGRFLKAMYQFWYKVAFGVSRQPIELSNNVFEDELNGGNIYGAKIFFGLRSKQEKMNKEINKSVRERFKDDIEASWAGQVIELTPVGCDKANAIKKYANLTNTNHDNIYVIGDSGNDISMFNEFHDNSFVMAHSYPSVKKYAKHEISRVYKIEKYVLGKESNNE